LKIGVHKFGRVIFSSHVTTLVPAREPVKGRIELLPGAAKQSREGILAATVKFARMSRKMKL
jgi:hypothetical protein